MYPLRSEFRVEPTKPGTTHPIDEPTNQWRTLRLTLDVTPSR